MKKKIFDKENLNESLKPLKEKTNKFIKFLDDVFKFKLITKYILSEYLTTFFIAFLFFFIIFFINQILLNIENLLKRSIPLDLVFSLMVTFFPEVFIFAFPFAVMLSTLMVMGRFSSDNEIVAFRALGFNLMKLFTPIFICGLFATVITFVIFDQLIPLAHLEQRKIIKKIVQIKPSLDLKSKTIKKYDNNTKIIYTNIVKENKVSGLFIIDRDENNEKRIITAESAEIISLKERKGVLELKMNNAMFQFFNKDRPNEFNYGYSETLSYFFNFLEFFETESKEIIEFYKTTIDIFKNVLKYKKVNKTELDSIATEYFNITMDIKALEFKNEQFLKNYISESEFQEYLKKIDSDLNKLLSLKKNKKKINPSLNVSLLELYRKFTTPLACIIFAIFAAPIGIYSRRAGFQIGFILGLFLTAIYWFSLAGSTILGRKFILIPFLSMLLPNLIFFIVGIIFLIKRLKE